MTTKKKPVKIAIKKPIVIEQPNPTIKSYLLGLKEKNRQFMSRRPHRSFRRTRRRDYARSLKLPGYWSFTAHVHKTIWKNRKIFLLLTLTYAVFTAFMVGIASQDTYTTLTDTLRSTGTDVFSGNLGELGKAGLLFVTAATGGLSQTLTEVQQVYAGLLAILTWLTTVWLLRNLLAGNKVKLRDGLYNASAPLLSTVVVALVLIIQLLPLAIALIGYSAAVSSGLLAGGVEAMLFWIVAGLLGLMSLYFITSTFIALVIVTLPGMYPFRALKTAGDLVVGRRVRILLRIVWMALTVAVAWIVILIPIILFDTWIKGLWPAIQGVPIIPFVLLAITSLSIVWSASYIYLLYRKVVADDALPA
jgi:hypothetical protein